MHCVKWVNALKDIDMGVIVLVPACGSEAVVGAGFGCNDRSSGVCYVGDTRKSLSVYNDDIILHSPSLPDRVTSQHLFIRRISKELRELQCFHGRRLLAAPRNDRPVVARETDSRPPLYSTVVSRETDFFGGDIHTVPFKKVNLQFGPRTTQRSRGRFTSMLSVFHALALPLAPWQREMTRTFHARISVKGTRHVFTRAGFTSACIRASSWGLPSHAKKRVRVRVRVRVSESERVSE